MKDNKGFSLLELLVTMAVLAIVMTEIAALMINSSKLYLNGTREVSLQTEAQLVIQQLEDLMVDADWGISHDYDAVIGSDRTITISANETPALIYTIEYKPSSDPSVSYGSLYLTQTGGDEPCTDLLLADYVGSVSLNMANFESNDVITIDVVMQNEQYSYKASQDIFCRNMIGSGRDTSGNKHNKTSEIELEVNRFAVVDLMTAAYSEIYNFEKENGTGYTYSFAWDPVTGTSGATPSALYSLNTTSNTVMCQSHMNKEDNFDKNYPNTPSDPECVLICTAEKGGSKSEVTRMKLVTPSVALGLGLSSESGVTTATSKYGYGMAFPSAANSSGYISPVKIRGIDPGYCTDIDYTFSLVRFDMSGVGVSSLDTVSNENTVNNRINKIKIDSDGYETVVKSGTWNTGSTTANPSFDKKDVVGNMNWSGEAVKEGGMIRDLIGCGADALQLNNVGFGSDSYSNSLLIYTDRMCNGAGHIKDYYNQIRAGYLLKGHFVMKFPGDKTMEYDLYFMPNGDGAGLEQNYMKNSLKIFYKMLEKIPAAP